MPVRNGKELWYSVFNEVGSHFYQTFTRGHQFSKLQNNTSLLNPWYMIPC